MYLKTQAFRTVLAEYQESAEISAQNHSLFEQVVELESRRYLSDIDMPKNLSVGYPMAVASYILSSYA